MTLTVYSGSSLYQDDIARLLDLAAVAGTSLVFRAPIVRGDLLSTSTIDHWGHRVLILDGHFGQSLTVSVTEIREYLARGMYLAGASSMGALRAVECRTLGMVRYGWVAEQYLTGRIDSDADVALLMDPVTSEALTVPLVNLRWLLCQLREQGQLGVEEHATALALAQGVHYRARMPAALAAVFRRELPAATARLLTDHLAPDTTAAWDRKRLDGIEAVESELRSIARFVVVA